MLFIHKGVFICLLYRDKLKEADFYDGERKVARNGQSEIIVPAKFNFVSTYIEDTTLSAIQDCDVPLSTIHEEFSHVFNKEYLYNGLAFKFHVLQKQETITTQRRKKIEAPRDILLNNLRQQCSMHDIEWSSDLEKDVAHKWEKHGDLILLPHHCFQREEWDKLGKLIHPLKY